MSVPTLSICTIVRNEEKQLDEYLHSIIDYGDEIVIADTGSTDRSLEILRAYENRYPKKLRVFTYNAAGPFHYGRARNFVISKATSDYCLTLDADERLSGDFKRTFVLFLDTERPLVASAVRKDELLPHLVDQVPRIMLRESDIRYGVDEQSRVHEQLVYHTEVKAFPGVLWHCQRQNHYLERPQRILPQLELQIERVPRTKSFLGHFLRGVWYALFRFKKIYFSRELYKDGVPGFKYAFLRSFDAFLVQFFVGLKPVPGKSFITVTSHD